MKTRFAPSLLSADFSRLADEVAEELRGEGRSVYRMRLGGSTAIGALGQSATPRLAKYYASGQTRAYRGLLLKLTAVGAVIGSTGAGKTTLVNLIPRLFDSSEGSVRVDGVDVRHIDPDTLWNRIGLVPQKVYLFSGTVASNLRYGKPDATEAEMWEALEIAQARNFVEAMPEGLESPISQGGTNISGGQRQRLAIARAIVGKPLAQLLLRVVGDLAKNADG